MQQWGPGQWTTLNATSPSSVSRPLPVGTHTMTAELHVEVDLEKHYGVSSARCREWDRTRTETQSVTLSRSVPIETVNSDTLSRRSRLRPPRRRYRLCCVDGPTGAGRWCRRLGIDRGPDRREDDVRDCAVAILVRRAEHRRRGTNPGWIDRNRCLTLVRRAVFRDATLPDEPRERERPCRPLCRAPRLVRDDPPRGERVGRGDAAPRLDHRDGECSSDTAVRPVRRRPEEYGRRER